MAYSLNEEGQVKMLLTLSEEHGVNELLDFIIERKGE